MNRRCSKRIRILGISGSLLFCAGTAFADELSEEDFFSDIPEVTSATRMVQKITDAPASITIIDQEMISASGANTIAELFRLVPGFQSHFVSSNKQAVTYHGVANDFPRRLEVMIDGRSVYLPLLSTVAWETLGIGLDDVERIEVVRGSNVPTFGSNAFFGAINIVTKTAYSAQPNSIKVTRGWEGTQITEGHFSDTTDLLSYRVSAGNTKKDGLEPFNDGADYNYLNLKTSFLLNVTDSIEFDAGFNQGHTRSVEMDNLNNPVIKRSHSANYQYLRWNRLLDDGDELQVSFYHNYLDLDIPDATAQDLVTYVSGVSNIPTAQALLAVNPGYKLDSEHGTTDLYDVEIQGTHSLSERFTTLWGTGFRYEKAKSDVLLSTDDYISEHKWRLFGNAQWTPSSQFTVNAGAMVENSSTTSSGTKLSPRISVGYHPDEQSVLRAGYSSAYRMPSLLAKNNEQTIDLISAIDLNVGKNPNIKPEHIRTFEIGYYRALKNSGHFDMRVFHERVTDGILSTWNNAPTDAVDNRIRVQDNVANWTNEGIEFQLQLKPTDSLSVTGSYSYTNTYNFEWDRRVRNPFSADAAQTPLHTASLLLDYRPNKQWSLSSLTYYSDVVDWEEGDLNEDFLRTDLKVSRTIPIRDTELELSLTIQNAFNHGYTEFHELNEFQRRAFVTAKLEF